MRELFSDIPEAVENTQKVADMCNLEILIDQRYFPKVETPEGDPEEYLKKHHEKLCTNICIRKLTVEKDCCASLYDRLRMHWRNSRRN